MIDSQNNRLKNLIKFKKQRERMIEELQYNIHG